MRIAIVTSGSRGDVQPYCVLGAELAARGHDVVVATEARMEAFVRSWPGLGYARLAGDPLKMLYEPDSQKLLAEGRFLKVMAAAEKYNAPFASEVLATTAAACEGADIIVAAALTQTPTLCVAEKLGVPWVPVYLGPIWPTREFPSWVFGLKPWRWKAANKASYRLLLAALWLQERGRINAWRVRELGLKPLKGGILPLLNASRGDIPMVLMCSYDVVPGLRRPPDYPEFVEFTGFAFPPATKEEDVDPKLRAFVAEGPAPVYLGFGSMPAPEPRKLLELVVEVVKSTGRRAVVAAGWSGLAPAGGDALPQGLLLVPSAPHDWLLPRCSAAVHHCGIGTCGAVLRAGIPSVPCPVLLDQPWNAQRLVEAGCAVEPLPFAKLTAPALASRIAQACDDGALRSRAAEVAARMAADWPGAAAAADLVLAAPNPWPRLRAAGAV